MSVCVSVCVCVRLCVSVSVSVFVQYVCVRVRARACVCVCLGMYVRACVCMMRVSTVWFIVFYRTTVDGSKRKAPRTFQPAPGSTTITRYGVKVHASMCALHVGANAHI